MIGDAHSALALFLACAGAALALAAGVTAARALMARGDRHRATSLMHLAELCLMTLGITALVAWPQLYALMASYVDELRAFGVMCTYGVSQIHPQVVRLLEIGLPLTLWCVGASLLLTWVDRRTPTGPLSRRRAWTTLGAAAVALATFSLEARYVLLPKAGQPVSCCTQLSGSGVMALPTRSLFPAGGPGGHALPLTLYFGLTALVIAAALWWAAAPASRGRTLLREALPILGILTLALSWAVWIASVAPLALRLPHHHCLYELLTDTLAMGLAGAATVAGCAGLVWLPVIAALGRPAAEEADLALRQVARACALALASSLTIVAIHIS